MTVSTNGPRATQRSIEVRLWCVLICKWEKVRRRKARAYFKRHSNKRVRSALKRDLRDDT